MAVRRVNPKRRGWINPPYLVFATRLTGAVIAWSGLFWRTRGETGFLLTGGVVLGIVALAMLHTRTGRRLLVLGWMFLVMIAVVNIVYVDVRWETMRAFLLVLAVGGLWFVDWMRLVHRLRLGFGLARSTGRSRR